MKIASIRKELLKISSLTAKIGSNPLLAQGAGGNSSEKIGNICWVKASGKWMLQALEQEIFVPLDTVEVQNAVAVASKDTFDIEISTFVPTELKPSIEATLHAVLNQRVVVHVHSINAIVHSITTNRRKQLVDVLHGLNWRFIPYRRPGLPLTLEVLREPFYAKELVLILENHGLVVAADDCNKASRLLEDVENRLKIFPRKAAKVQKFNLKNITVKGWHLTKINALNELAVDPLSFEIIQKRIFFPDQVVFLGDSIPAVKNVQELSELLRGLKISGKRRPCILIENEGSLLRDDIKDVEVETLKAVSEVVMRLEEVSDISSLSRLQIETLMNWDAEKYRQNIQ